MRYTKLIAITLLFSILVAAGCKCVGPEIIPDTTGDSAVTMALKAQIEKNQKLDQNWSWIVWYILVLFLVVAWGYKEFFAKKKN
jgi:hypothetical protein